MEKKNQKISKFGRGGKSVIILVHATVGWAFCGAIIGIGRHLFSIETTLVIHAIGAPLGFALISFFYFHKFGFTSPLWTAILFLAIVVGFDLFLVAPVFERSFAMFTSVVGTWLPFALIFLSIYVTGVCAKRYHSWLKTDTGS